MGGENWEEAQTGQQANQLQPAKNETDLTTDDLVFMLGESAVQGRGKDKILRYQAKVIQTLQTELKAAQSLAAGKETLTTEIENLKKEIEALRKSQAIEIESLKKSNQAECETLNKSHAAECETLKKSHLNEFESLKKSIAGKDAYILQMEKDCHAIALERDGLKKEKEEFQQSMKDVAKVEVDTTKPTKRQKK